jgi:hypothetical protein
MINTIVPTLLLPSDPSAVASWPGGDVAPASTRFPHPRPWNPMRTTLNMAGRKVKRRETALSKMRVTMRLPTRARWPMAEHQWRWRIQGAPATDLPWSVPDQQQGDSPKLTNHSTCSEWHRRQRSMARSGPVASPCYRWAITRTPIGVRDCVDLAHERRVMTKSSMLSQNSATMGHSSATVDPFSPTLSIFLYVLGVWAAKRARNWFLFTRAKLQGRTRSWCKPQQQPKVFAGLLSTVIGTTTEFGWEKVLTSRARLPASVANGRD